MPKIHGLFGIIWLITVISCASSTYDGRFPGEWKGEFGAIGSAENGDIGSAEFWIA